jgi:glycosyltransferase involved in cell wall biosynthesis
MRKKLAILTNLIAPSRIPIYLGLGEAFEILVAIGKPESNRSEWSLLDQELSSAGVKVEVASGKTFTLSETRFLQINPGYFRILFREKPDAVITIELGFRTIVAYFYTKVKNKPLWIWWAGTPHSERALWGIRDWVRHYFAKKNVRWISYGLESTRYLASLGVPENRILQIQNGVDEKRFTALGACAAEALERPLLLVVGQLIERKGLEPLLQAAKRLQERGSVFTLRFVGSGPRRPMLERCVEELKIRNVQFIGGISPGEIPAHYRSADALVFPTLEDVWGLVANEALLCGTPVICSKYAGCASELLDPDDIFDPLNEGDFDRALSRAISGQVKPPAPERIWPIERVTETLRLDIEKTITERERTRS